METFGSYMTAVAGGSGGGGTVANCHSRRELSPALGWTTQTSRNLVGAKPTRGWSTPRGVVRCHEVVATMHSVGTVQGVYSLVWFTTPERNST